jgi:hypothetical protein
VLSRQVSREMECRVQACKGRRYKTECKGGDEKLSIDRWSGGRRSARLIRRAPRSDSSDYDAVGVFDGGGDNGQRQLRWRRGNRTAQERDAGADCAVIVVVWLVLSRRWDADTAVRTREHDRRTAADAVDVHMAERQQKLKRHRRNGEADSVTSAPTYPLHSRYANVTVLHLARVIAAWNTEISSRSSAKAPRRSPEQTSLPYRLTKHAANLQSRQGPKPYLI